MLLRKQRVNNVADLFEKFVPFSSFSVDLRSFGVG
jgi:hypothetical protein